MEQNTIKRNGRIIDILFDGEHYTFTDRFMGLMAIATRTEPTGHDFDIVYGNSNNYYQSDNLNDCLICEKYIQKSESKYIEVECTFNRTQIEVNNTYYITIGINAR